MSRVFARFCNPALRSDLKLWGQHGLPDTARPRQERPVRHCLNGLS